MTGAGHGLGRAHALALAARGVKVVVNDLGGDTAGRGASADAADSVVSEIVAAGGEAVADHGSVAEASDAQHMVDVAIRSWGSLDIVINNAGVSPGRAGIVGTPADEWERVLGVHLGGTINVTRAAWPHLLRSDAGRLVNTSSSTVLGAPTALTYATAKGAILGLSRALAFEAEGTSMRVNTVMPFGTSRLSVGDFAVKFESDFDLPPGEFETRFSAAAVAEGVVALCHPAQFSSGEVFAIGGGRLARVFLAATNGVEGRRADEYLDGWTSVLETNLFSALPSSVAFKHVLLGSEGADWRTSSRVTPRAD